MSQCERKPLYFKAPEPQPAILGRGHPDGLIPSLGHISRGIVNGEGRILGQIPSGRHHAAAGDRIAGPEGTSATRCCERGPQPWG